ncbi:MAG: TetR family transcriptional regulator C-terminal domain-containing protein [Gammaproteobacteria bacterium]|nr:TetR family transcriptional regulator C-terminal domain-containing protein [Gammaproteobacteria bacterium]
MPKQVDHALRRRELVAASWDVISREGLEALTLRKVAAAADCTTGRIAHYFDGREELLLAALSSAYAAAEARMVRIERSSRSAEDRLRGVIHEALPLNAERLKEWRVWLVFWAAAATNDDLAQENTRRYVAWQRMLARLITEHAGPVNAQNLAFALVAMIDGIGVRTSLSPDARHRKLARAAIDRWIADLDA